jgi:hypothetical protein
MTEAYHKIVASGMKVAMNKGPDGIMGSLKGSQDPVSDIVRGAIGVVGLLQRSAKGTMPPEAMILAGWRLALEGFDFAERAGILTVGAAELNKGAQLYAETILPKLGMTPEKLQKTAQQVQGIVRDPQKMAQLKKQQGASNGAA